MEYVADVTRSGLVESRHQGVVVCVGPAGEVEWSVSDPATIVFPRSSNKPFQIAALVREGLDLPSRLMALATSSHSGEDFHLAGAREILAGAGLDESALQTPPDYPMGEEARDAYIRAGGFPAPICMDCSGKHAAMLWVCVQRGWDTASYLAPEHPLQRAIAATFVELTGAPIAVTGVDGCGAPLFATTLEAVTRGFGRLIQAAPGSAESRVVSAIVAHPEYVSGTTRDERALLRAFPGAIAKFGAEAVYLVAMPDGRAIGVKIGDGGDRARPVVMAAALTRAGYVHPVLDAVAVVLGGGQPVGSVRATFPTG
ncbi:asparaginase [soil metagenome]